MSDFREIFYSTLQEMLVVSKNELLVDKMPTNDPHNITSRILRNGLAISAFSMLESYIYSVFDESMNDIAQAMIKYLEFPDRLKKFITLDAIFGLTNRVRTMDRNLQQQFVDDSLSKISSFSGEPPIYTTFGLSANASNLNHEDVTRSFAALGISDPWRWLGQIAADIGTRRLSLKEDFRAVARTRHRSAHVPEQNIATQDLQDNIIVTCLLAIAIDILASESSRIIKVCKRQENISDNIKKISLAFRFVDALPNGKFRELDSDISTAIRQHSDLKRAVHFASRRRRRLNTIVRDTSGVPTALVRPHRY